MLVTCLNPDDYVTGSDVVVLPDGVELGNPTIVALPMTGVVLSVAAVGCIQNFARLSLALTGRGVTFAWTTEHQVEFDTLKACLLHAPILGFPTKEGRFILDTDASLFAVGGVLNQLQDYREVVIAYASRSLWFTGTVLHIGK